MRAYLKLLPVLLFLVIALPVRATNTQTDWPMVGADPARTSHNSVEVRGDATKNPDLQVEWYHVIDPYVDNKVQVIATGGQIYLATSKGLYAFDEAGNQKWVYGTELPLGNSPTIATINGKSVAFTPGFDHRIQAIDTTNGAPISGYTPFEAGAGFETIH